MAKRHIGLYASEEILLQKTHMQQLAASTLKQPQGWNSSYEHDFGCCSFLVAYNVSSLSLLGAVRIAGHK